MSTLKIKRLTVAAAPGESGRAGVLAGELARLLRERVPGTGPAPSQRKLVITLTLGPDASAEQVASQVAAELRRKLGLE